VTPRELALWSFLMSSAHGAGLMLFPVLRGLPAEGHGHVLPGINPIGASLAQDVAAVLLHTLAMLVVMGLVAIIVYEKVGLGVLRKAWVNLDLLWAATFVMAGAVTLFT
ncbi:MAG: hypothetical protein M3O34_06935, partial [Chloroflexota bacterium]|nr:hypothetical protein [Chloroflexota bacterium]